jgi:transcription initiation factor TFIID TATA-box-binding protein
VVCTGTQSPTQAKEAVHKIIDELREADIEIGEKPDITVQNMVASSELDATLNLNRIAFELVGTEYEPEQFPGLVYRLDEPKVVFLLFSSGRIVCTGGKTYDDVENGIEKLKENLKELGAM